MKPRLVSRKPSLTTKALLALAFIVSLTLLPASLFTKVFNDPEVNDILWWSLIILAPIFLGSSLWIVLTAPKVYCDENFFYWVESGKEHILNYESIMFVNYLYDTDALRITYRNEIDKSKHLLFFTRNSRTGIPYETKDMIRQLIQQKNPKAWTFWSDMYS